MSKNAKSFEESSEEYEYYDLSETRYVPENPDISWKRFLSMQKEYLNVPYNEKDKAKKLGAMWDKDRKSWYTYKVHDKSFDKWRKIIKS